MGQYSGIIKSRGFSPAPIADFGIPDFANSAANKNVIGTTAHEDWWNEQFNYCINGYTTGGIFIPGRYYYYLNFCTISSIGRGRHHPDFVDLDLEFFRLVDEAKRTYKGIIMPKARRIGASEKAVSLLSHGMRFTHEEYRAGVCAGVEKYVESFYKKLKGDNSTKEPELMLHFLTQGEEMKAGWVEQTTSGWVEKGSKNLVLCRTMFSSGNVFKGELLNDCIFEEAGEFKKLIEGFGATQDCFAVGPKMVGFPLVFGTGGAMQTSSKDFAQMWSEAESYNLLKFDVLAPRLLKGYFVGSKNEKGIVEEHCPNVFEKYKDYHREQIRGIEDVEEATRVILNTRKQLSTLKNRKKYWDYVQNNPLVIGDVFLKFSGNNFDPEALAEQQMYLDQLATPKYGRFVLSWKKNTDGSFVQPLAVDFTPAPIETPDELCVLVHEKGMPDVVKHYQNLVLQGVDSYDQDRSDTSKSLGSSIIGYRKGNPINPACRIPIAIYCERPRRKEIFWDISLMMSVAWNTAPHNTMIDAAKPGIIYHYKANGCRRYLAYRPLSFESDKSEQTHEFGVLFTTSSKSLPQMISIAQSWVLDEIHECVFPIVIHHFTHYDTTVTDSDNDTADAWFCWLARDADMKRQATQETGEEEDPMQLPYYEEDADGNVIQVEGKYVDPKAEEDPDKPKTTPDLFIQRLNNGLYG